ncbi:MAG: sigma-70 family RNA polymerase sigma factor [Planctomycetes bacterium]|jgi:RNA polymerase sigma-70 factor (ECF subfamily)|nr:sigma-70 family RNA polymerase sigma factor [Planctomycetota bacterium]
MMRSRLDRAFARYARTGDPRALGRVFDGCAVELYRLAFHLLGDRHTAEDLVQQTFVVAIEQAATFDRSRAVQPWLCGILTHRALQLRRQLRQRAAAAPVARLNTFDPAVEVVARETEERVAAAVRALPEPYRQVLLLHLVHDLSGKDIAEALARPEATVRTQLARGLERLRKALPVGIGGVASALVPPPLGLAAVREAVMAKAAAGAAAGSLVVGGGTLALTGVLLMKKVVLSVVVVCIAFAAWQWWAVQPALPVAVGSHAATVTSAAAQQAPLPTAVATDVAVVDRVPVPQDADARTAGLEVTVLWHDGTPAADAAVRCRPKPLDYEAWLQVARSGDDGVARFDGLPPGPANVLTGRGAAADVELLAGQGQRLTITVPQGVDVHGRVIDTDERPVAGATIWLSVSDNSDDCESAAVSDALGAFSIRDAGPLRNLTATAPGLGCANITHVEGTEMVLRMRVAPGTLLGSVVDAEGRPIDGARVLLGVTRTEPQSGLHSRFLGRITGQDIWPSRFLRTDAAGSFRSEGLPALPWPLWVGAPGFATACQVVTVSADAPTSVTIRLTAGATVSGRITDAAGRAMAGVEIHAWPEQPPLDERIAPGPSAIYHRPLWGRRSAVTGDDGVYQVKHVMPGKMRLHAWHPDGHVTEACELADGQSFVWNAVLESEAAKGEPLHGTLVGERGEALTGWIVRVDRPESYHASTWISVDDDGSFRTNRVPPGPQRLFAMPNRPMRGDELDLGLHDVANCPLRLVVPSSRVPTARVRGRIVASADSLPERCAVWVTRRDGGESMRVRCDAEGRYEAGPLQAGDYRLRVEVADGAQFVIGTFAVAHGGETDAGTFTLPPIGRLVVTLVDAAGKRLVDGWVLVWPVGDQDRGGSLEHREGRASGNLPAGRWRIETRDLTALAAIEVDVRAGETREVELVVAAGVRYALRVPSNLPAGDRWRLRQYAASGMLLRDSYVNAHDAGKDLSFAAPPGRYTLEVLDTAGRRATTVCDLRASEPPMVVELKFPAR